MLYLESQNIKPIIGTEVYDYLDKGRPCRRVALGSSGGKCLITDSSKVKLKGQVGESLLMKRRRLGMENNSGNMKINSSMISIYK